MYGICDDNIPPASAGFRCSSTCSDQMLALPLEYLLTRGDERAHFLALSTPPLQLPLHHGNVIPPKCHVVPFSPEAHQDA